MRYWAALVAGITAYNSNSTGASFGVDLAAGLVGIASDAMVGDIDDTMVTDIQISEKTAASVQTGNVSSAEQGTSGDKVQSSIQTGNQHKYQTRVAPSANKVNLKFEKAKSISEE